jgi:cytochrome b561
MYDSKQKLSGATVSLHWVVAATVFGLWPLGYYMAHTRTYALWPLHQSTGDVLFVVILLRLIWRFKNGWPQPVSVYSRFEQILAKTVHWTLVVALVVMPLSGLVSTYAGGYDITVFGWQIIPDVPNHAIVPANAIHKLKVIPRSEALHDFLQQVHIVFAWILAGAVALHITGALKHHLVDKDGTLRRMLGARVA